MPFNPLLDWLADSREARLVGEVPPIGSGCTTRPADAFWTVKSATRKKVQSKDWEREIGLCQPDFRVSRDFETEIQCPRMTR
jgi:hypothetical protein